MKNLKIYCVTNKELSFLKNINYNFGWVGEGINPNNYILCNNKDNIFFKEKFYSELTFHYWYWKNQLDLNDDSWIGFCQKRRFWIKKDSIGKKIDKKNLHEHYLSSVPDEWTGYEAIVCNPISVNNVKKIKMIKRGIKSILKNPEIFFNEKKQSLNFHFDMHHGYGNLRKAIEFIDDQDKYEFLKFVENSTSYKPNFEIHTTLGNVSKFYVFFMIVSVNET